MPCRELLNFNTKWLYIPEDCGNYSQVSIDESSFEKVSVPHTNKLHPHNYFCEHDYQFVSWYRRHFTAKEEWKDRRVAVEFEGAMIVAEIFLNGEKLFEHKGGYTPFTVELTDKLLWGKDNVLAVRLDSCCHPDVPPEGEIVDYMLFGGIYRNVNLVVSDRLYLEHVFISSHDVTEEKAVVKAIASVNNKMGSEQDFVVTHRLLDQDGKVIREISSREEQIAAGETKQVLCEFEVNHPHLWNLNDPFLYTVKTEISGQDNVESRIGIRSIRFNENSLFELNGKVVKLTGHNRHQNFPYLGGAMCDRYQREDADILKYQLGCNFMRTSHYPQAKSFLDRCDEIGLLVFEELPGWQFIGDESWKQLCYQNITDMIYRDYNHPSIIMWGVRINESLDDDDFYTKTNALAHELDPTRPTTGVRYLRESSFLEDVYGFNDYHLAPKGELRRPNYHPYFVSEYLGVMFPTKSYDNIGRQVEFARRHASSLNAFYRSSDMAGATGWSAFDYNTHIPFGHGDRVCYHGLTDIFRIPKLAAYVHQSQVDAKESKPMVFIAKYLVPAYFEDHEELDQGYRGRTYVFSNCEEVELFFEGESMGRLKPDDKAFPYLPHPPFVFEVPYTFQGMRETTHMEAVGYIDGKEAARFERKISVRARAVKLEADYSTIEANGYDLTRVVVSVVDEHGQYLPFCQLPVTFTLEGPGELIGENPLGMEGGRAAVYVRSTMETGVVKLTGKCRDLDSCEIQINFVKPNGTFVS